MKIKSLAVKKIKYILKGLGSYLPDFINKYLPRHQHQFYGRGSIRNSLTSAHICYSLWLRYLVVLEKNGISTKVDSVAEIGPGDSLGVGLAALLSGVNKYYALDIAQNIFSSDNIKLFDELVELFLKRAPILNNHDLPKAKPVLDTYEFPRNILNEKILEQSLNASRIKKIRNMLINLVQKKEIKKDENIVMRYFAPWDKDDVIQKESIDMIFSCAVMEHVEDIDKAYGAMNLWLKKEGIFCHAIDFKSHNTAPGWNGHWTCSDIVWKMIRGKCVYLINREPYSRHISSVNKYFNIICSEKYVNKNNLSRKQLAKKFRNLTDEDMITASAFIAGKKI